MSCRRMITSLLLISMTLSPAMMPAGLACHKSTSAESDYCCCRASQEVSASSACIHCRQETKPKQTVEHQYCACSHHAPQPVRLTETLELEKFSNNLDSSHGFAISTRDPAPRFSYRPSLFYMLSSRQIMFCVWQT